MQIFTLGLAANAPAGRFTGRAGAALPLPEEVPAAQPHPEQPEPSRKPSPAIALPPSHSTYCCNLGKAWQSTYCSSLFSSKSNNNLKKYRKTPRILNIRRAISITFIYNYIQAFTC